MHQGKKIQEYRERVMGLSQEELGQRIGRSRRTVITIEQTAYIQDIRLRRTLAWALQIPPKVLDLPEDALLDIPAYIPIDNSSFVKSEPLNSAYIEIFLDNLRMRLNLYYLGSTLDAAKNLDTHIKQLHNMMLQCDLPEERASFLVLLSHNYQIKGMIARDQLKFDIAEECFRQASLFAQQGECVELNALAMGRQAGTYLIRKRLEDVPQKQKDLQDALRLYEIARDISKRSTAVLRAYIAIGHAEAQGVAGDKGCFTSLEDARIMVKRIDPEDDHLLLFNSTRCSEYSVHDCWAQCRMLIGEPNTAIEYYDRVEGKLDLNMTRMRARLYIQYAEALYANNDLSCCFYTAEGWKLARSTHSLYNMRRSEILAAKVASKYQNDSRVRDLLEMMQE